ncbi:MAG TPA: peptidoglycan-binding protein [Ignavibacteria bacterium]|nr:peptidoglycan-binding protein [Ignavibacteria bacterium]
MYKEIASHFISKIAPSKEYRNPSPVKDRELLFITFREKLESAIKKFNENYPDVEVLVYETYRSNILQQKYFSSGVSRIRQNGMHHFGIAADCAFRIKGKFSYSGDYKYLHKCFKDEGLVRLSWEEAHIQLIPVSSQELLRNEVNKEIKKFQKTNGLTADGIIGNKTLKKLSEIYL